MGVTTFWLDLSQVHQVNEKNNIEYLMKIETIFYEEANKIDVLEPGGVCYDLRHLLSNGMSNDPNEHDSYPLQYDIETRKNFECTDDKKVMMDVMTGTHFPGC